MTAAVLPGFGGLSFFTAVAQQQQRARGCLLPVPALAAADADDAVSTLWPCCSTGPAPGWVQQALQVTRDLCFEPQPIAAVAAGAPRSKAEKQIKKQACAALCQQVQPSAIPPASPSTNQQQATLASVTASHVSSFCGLNSSRSCTSFGAQQQLALDEPVISEANTAWGKATRVQVGTHTAALTTSRRTSDRYACCTSTSPKHCMCDLHLACHRARLSCSVSRLSCSSCGSKCLTTRHQEHGTQHTPRWGGLWNSPCCFRHTSKHSSCHPDKPWCMLSPCVFVLCAVRCAVCPSALQQQQHQQWCPV